MRWRPASRPRDELAFTAFVREYYGLIEKGTFYRTLARDHPGFGVCDVKAAARQLQLSDRRMP